MSSDSTLPRKLYPSSSGFALGFSVYTKYNSACLRKTLLNAYGHREQLKQSIQDIGAANEQIFEESLKASNATDGHYEREKAVKAELLPASNTHRAVILSGRIDFFLDHGSHTECVELKSTSSVNKRRELRKGELAPENLAQLLAYMVETESVTGRLIYTFYDDQQKAKENFTFAVIIEDSGSVTVNGTTYKFNIYDYLHHRELATFVLSTDSILPRPVNADKAFDSPCTFCIFKDRCERFDKRVITTVQQFVA